MSSFEFNAPQFVNFAEVDDPKADRFFDLTEQTLYSSSKVMKKPDQDPLDTENQVPSLTVNCRGLPNSKKNKPTPRKHLHEIFIHQNCTNSETKDQLKSLPEQFEKLRLSETKQKKVSGPVKATQVFGAIKCVGSEKKIHPMITRSDIPKLKSSMQSLGSVNSQDSSENQVSTTFNDTVAVSVKRNASPLHSAKKFISLAEQVEHFYKDTPERYRSKPNKQRTPTWKTMTGKPNCVPRTPNLIAKFRQRKVDYPDEKQREEMELEEIKKHQIKARPVNEKILMGACLNLKAPIIKKPVTVPQPFSLTEVRKKEPAPAPEPVFHFKAQPIPTAILNGPVGIPPRRVISPTIPNTPQIKVPARLRVEVKSQEKSGDGDNVGSQRIKKVQPRLSFEVRMKDLLQKKEEYIKKVLEEEKKSFNSFKAHPMPDFRKKEQTPKIEVKTKTIMQPFNLSQARGHKIASEEQNAIRVTPFKARPASVVHQKPFVPKIERHDVQLPTDFHLNTEKRAMERQKFDEKIKQKEEEKAMILKLQQEEEERLEREKMLIERKKTAFKAKPMPRYKPFEIQEADPEKLTQPHSPNFSTKSKKENN